MALRFLEEGCLLRDEAGAAALEDGMVWERCYGRDEGGMLSTLKSWVDLILFWAGSMFGDR